MPKRAAPYAPTPSMFDVGICVALQLVATGSGLLGLHEVHVGLYELSPPDFLRPGKGHKYKVQSSFKYPAARGMQRPLVVELLVIIHSCVID